MRSGSSSVMVFDEYLMSGNTTTLVTSAPMRVLANTPVLAVTLINTEATVSALTFQLQGSYDGHAWEPIGNAISTLTSFGYATQKPGKVDYVFIRVRAELTGSGTIPPYAALFSAMVAFSEQ